MKPLRLSSFLIFSALLLAGWSLHNNSWLTEKHPGYDLIYTSADKGNISDYNRFVEKGIESVMSFFNSSFDQEFKIYVHPNRNSLDSSWQKEWNMPGFKSECWMVASGMAYRMDIISPAVWDKESCEHVYSDSLKTQQLITHELVHVFHGQKNVSKDFSATEGIDWFIEGLAVYASGQMDTQRLAEVKKAIAGNNIPTTLDNFWTGKIRYGLSGSTVLYIHKKYGSKKLQELLPLSTKSEILSALNITEPDFIVNWKKFIGEQ